MDEKLKYPHLRRGMCFALLGGIFWGFSGNCAEVLIDNYGADVIWITPARMFIAASAFLLIALIRYRPELRGIFSDRKMLLITLVFGCIGVLFMQYSYLYAIEFAGAGCALMFEQLCLIFIMVYVCIRGGRLPYLNEWLGVVFAFIGVYCLATQGNPNSLALSPEALFWCILSGVTMALYNILPEEPLKRYPTVVVSAIAMFFGSALSIAFSSPWQAYVDLPIDGWLVFAGLTLIGTVAAYLLYIQGIKDAGPMRASLLAVMEPVTGVVISAIWIGTQVSIWDILGLVFIVIMVVFETIDVKSIALCRKDRL